jgi:hypothetical protein
MDLPDPDPSASGYAGSDPGDGDGNKGPDGAIMFVPPSPPKKNKKQSPQDAIDEFWGKFNSTTPGRGNNFP